MIRKILSLFLILVAVGAGLCSAQTAGKKYYLVGGLFFEGMPPGVGSDNVAAFIIHEDGARHEVTELRLRKGIVLSEEVREYATPADEVPGAEAFLMSYRGGTGKKLPIGGAVQTLMVAATGPKGRGRGKSGLHRAGCQITSGGGDSRDSATEINRRFVR